MIDEEAYEEWLADLFWESGGAISPLEAHRIAREKSRHGKPFGDFRRTEGFGAFHAKVRKAAIADTIDIPGLGSVTRRLAIRIGGALMLNVLSGYRTYVGGAAKVLAGLGAILTALGGLLGYIEAGDLNNVANFAWYAGIATGAKWVGDGFSTIGLAGKAEKEMAVQIAIASGQPQVAKAVLAGDVKPQLAADVATAMAEGGKVP